MKKIKVLTTVFFFILFYSCNMQSSKTSDKKEDENQTKQSIKELIIGKWQFARIDFSELMKGREIDPMDKMEISFLQGMYKSLSMEFFNDNTYEVSFDIMMNNGSVLGTYKFLADEKYLETTYAVADKEPKTERKEVVSCTSDSLYLKTDKNLLVVYFRVKK